MLDPKDQKVLDLVRQIADNCADVIDWVEGVGNFDAACDRLVEKIVEDAAKLHETHESIFTDTKTLK